MPKLKKIKVDGQTVTILWNQKLGKFAQGYPKAGDYHRNQIRVAGGMTDSQTRHTVLHELLHHCWERAELRSMTTAKMEELIVDSLDVWLFTALNKNPELREFLFGDAGSKG